MSTSPVMSITDEIVAELEALANGATTGPWMTETESGHLNVASEDWYLLQCHHDQPNYEEDAEYIASANPSTILALLAERKELVRDRERLDSLDKLCEAYGFEVHEGNRWVIDGPFRSVRDAIDSLPDDAAIDAARGEA